MASNYLDPSTWRHKFPVVLSPGSGTLDPNPPRYRILKQEGQATSGIREVTTTYLVRARDLDRILDYLVPPVTTIAGSLNIIPEYNNAPYPGVPTLKAQRVTWRSHEPGKPVDPYQSDSQNLTTGNTALYTPTYHHVLELDVTYTNTLKTVQAIDPWTWCDWRANTSGEYITIEGSENITLGTANSGRHPENPIPEIAKILPMIEWTCSWPHVTKSNFENTMRPKLNSAMGKVNTTPFKAIFDAPAQTILFVGYDVEEEGETEFGDAVIVPLTVDMKFLEKNIYDSTAQGGEKQVNHNVFYNKDNGLWEKVFVDGRPVFASYEMNNLFDYPNNPEPPEE